MSVNSTAAVVRFRRRSTDVGSVVSPVDSRRRIRAVLFDLDGTLYDQRRMRLAMAMELALLPATRPLSAARTWRGVSAYRRAQESLRFDGWSGSAESAQLDRASAVARIPPAELAAIVDEWMFRRPLKYLRLCRVRGVFQLLSYLARFGVERGVLSDYPATDKLRALGLDGEFSIVSCTTDPDVGYLKPHPRGFLAACARWQMDPAEVLVVGDRHDADAAGAAAAGMPCVIVGSSNARTSDRDVLTLPSLERLYRVLVHHNSR